MNFYLNTTQVRPSRLDDNKDKKWHVDYARWTLNTFNNPLQQKFIAKTLANWSFYKGGDGQWIFDEDLESFFMDETGNVRNRLKIAKNLIKPMVEQYVGNAVRLEYRAKAKSESDYVINRREEQLAKMQFFRQVGDLVPEFKNVIKNNVPIGETEEETEEIFENLFIEDYENSINYLLDYVAEKVDIEELKVVMAKHLALSGLGIYKGYEQNQEYLAGTVDPTFFIRDYGAKKPDLSDSEFMGEWYYMDTPTIFERFQEITDKEREAIENYSRQHTMNIHRMINNYYQPQGGKVPVYEIYFKDTEKQEYGYVMDEFGYPYFTRINHESSDYTDKDLMKDPPEEAYKKILKGKKKATIYVDILRYCIFIPKEEVASRDDIVLEWGVLPYQEKYKLDPSNVCYPYKCYTWAYDRGEILSPIDDAIDPQRMVNRLISVAESHIASATGSGPIISKDAVDENLGEAGTIAAMNQSKPLTVDTQRTGSVANSVGRYGSSIDSGTVAMFNFVQEFQRGIEETTGVNSAMTGTQGGPGVLKGVIQQQIQQGSLVQEPFYWALTRILKQAYKHIGNVGKRIYADNPRRLAIITGDGGAQQIVITKEQRNEDFRIFFERTEGKASAINNANALIMTLLQTGLIDSKHAANLFNRADADMVADAMRQYQQELSQVQKLQQQQQAKQAQMMQAQLEAEREQEQAQIADAKLREDIHRKEDQDFEIEKIIVRNEGQIKKNRAKT